MKFPYFRCCSCDKLLNEVEVNARYARSGESIGLCTRCISWLPPDVGVVGLDTTSQMDEEFDEPDIDEDRDADSVF